MPDQKFHEKRFYDALRDIFVGAKVEGKSGFINLMQIKSRYYTQGVFPRLKADIEATLKQYPDFREELFDKLYSFFKEYFSESGSIYFRYTPLHKKIYEKVYTDERDVILFWKTHMLYYVKTDRVFTSLAVPLDDLNFFFDASQVEHKRANEKRELVFNLKEVRPDQTLVFQVSYSERGSKTKEDDILRQARQAGLDLEAETLSRALRAFEKQSEVDYFINKDARAFLQEQFELWLYQYLFAGQNIWSAERLARLQSLKAIAYQVIDFISQFEDELVKVWNKPKFVLNSHYILTLDYLLPYADLMERLFAHPGMAAQLQEWRELSMFDTQVVPDLQALWELLQAKDLLKEPLQLHWQYLPVDTRHFPDLELDLLALFDDLDVSLDGWLVHSENYQALNTLLPKFRGLVQCIHIDPPYNTETSGFLYANYFLHSSWLTMMDNRIKLGLDLISQDGAILCHIDENEYERLYLLFEHLNLPNVGTIVWDKRNPMNSATGIAKQHEYIIWRSKTLKPIYQHGNNVVSMLNKAEELVEKYGKGSQKAQDDFSNWIRQNRNLTGGEKAYRFLDSKGRIYQSVSLRAPEPRTDPKFFIPLVHPITGKPCPVPPNGFSRTPENLNEMIIRDEIIFGEDESIQPRQKMFLTPETRKQFTSLVQDAKKGKAELSPMGLDFPYCHPTSLYQLIISAATSNTNSITLDFFAGSGTTAHAVMNLNREDGGKRKYILVEMGEHFHTDILPRIKKIAFHSKWKDGKPHFAKGERGMSHFVKYFDLEQYEETLQRARYRDGDLFDDPHQDPYHSYVFLR